MTQAEVDEFNIDEKPSELLINSYEKFPLYIEVVASQIGDFFSYKTPFNTANLHSIDILSEHTQSQVLA